MKSKLIKLINGDYIRSDVITGIRFSEAVTYSEMGYPPKVYVDIGEGISVICDFNTDEEAKDYRDVLFKQLEE